MSSLKAFAFLIASTAAVVGIWFTAYVQEFERLNSDYQLYLEQNGEDQVANKIGGDLSSPFYLTESLIQKVTGTDGNYVTISSIVSGVNQDTGKEIFHSEQTYHVDAYSLTYKDMPQKQFGFKPGVQKQNYDFIQPMVFADVPLVYQHTDTVNGLEVYVFNAQTHNLDITGTSPLYPGVQILSNSNSTFWIEPTTGDLIKFEKSWIDYQVQNNKTIAINEKGWKKTTTYSSFILSEATKSKISDYYYNTRIMPILLGSLTVGINVILILRSKLRRSTETLVKNAKLTAIGNLSARMSHDLRNTLTVIKGEVSIMSMDENKDAKTNERLQRLNRAIDKMDNQIGEVLDFVREKPLKIEDISSTKLINRALEGMYVPEGVTITTPVQDVKIRGDYLKLETVLSNIVINAVQAIGKIGQVTISVEGKPDGIVISITDSGPGIPEKHLSKIFEPLFTTKPLGTGLGLASCDAIIKSHGGKISVTNNPTTFTIWLPKNSK
jgi:signal transduction histidine kinase